MNAHTHDVENLAKDLNVDVLKGLSQGEVESRKKIFGRNSLSDDSKIDYKTMVIHQVCNAMVLVLVISSAISFGIRDWITGGVIAFVIALNVLIGLFQEYKATVTMNSLKALSTPYAHLLRDGSEQEIASEELVPGDLCYVKVGDTVPADLRLINCNNFETDEALLTGESLPVAKDANITYDAEKDVPVGDRFNMAYASSVVVKGRAQGIVVNTGLNTEIGKIAEYLRSADDIICRDPTKSFFQRWWITLKRGTGAFLGITIGTPLHRKLSMLAVLLFCVAVVFAIVVLASQSFHVNRGVAVYAICVALSMIPSSLVVVLTITMSVGAAVMAERNVIIRKLDSLEALGAVNDVCSDKTGTLTQGKMLARQIWIPKLGTIEISSTDEPFNPTVGEVSLKTGVSPLDSPDSSDQEVVSINDFESKYRDKKVSSIDGSIYLTEWLETAALANIAKVYQENGTGEWKAHGDPTEVALRVFTMRMGMHRSLLTTDESTGENNSDDSSSEKTVQKSVQSSTLKYSFLMEFPFDSTIKRMSTTYKNTIDGTINVFTKGALESVLKCCSSWYAPTPGSKKQHAVPLEKQDSILIQNVVEKIASKGLRVLALAKKTLPSDLSDTELEKMKNHRDLAESGLCFLGLVGIYDPPRRETEGAIKKFHTAGINVRMLTGDFPGTAKAIAQEIGLLPQNLGQFSKELVDSMIMTGTQFDHLSNDQIDKLPSLPLVVARCSPQTKVRMIEALHRRDKFCAMTGDGVNDSPSLKMANIGIAMGINGSDVAKDASDIVLSDDNFASILNAVEEGRRMTDNIQKFVLQLLAGNWAQTLFMIVGISFFDNDGMSVYPLSPVEVLWVIIVTACFPAMSLGLEKAAPDLMERPPNDSKMGIFTWEVIIDMFSYGLLMAISCMATFTTVLYGTEGGQLGHNCNTEDNFSCKGIFRARSATFATLTWCELILAWEVMDARRSFFRMHPELGPPVRQFFKDLVANKYLFWSITLGFATAFPVVYIPVINTKVFLHGPIGYEWALAIAYTFVFLLGIEMYKYFKRVYLRLSPRIRKTKADSEQNLNALDYLGEVQPLSIDKKPCNTSETRVGDSDSD
ncbi:uncharacterized protein TDEL_0G04940 [Torulaspora delbrueckii]|uniref:P-type Na(+) transporter n=1 Tax=Torulaspora delbrueckii TaxID=4950 RepID=G8ZY94_TORDE|nr:hypothetical protein TDEL_0G04940 [Torulaspora delbrueckii]CCE93861.1 hypothetical protein TDEL_0G04940 [Torulaspora delbrueckii]